MTPTQWKAVQGDPGATLEDTHGSVFHWAGYQTDPTYAQTNNVLATYRLALQNRVNQVGPPRRWGDGPAVDGGIHGRSDELERLGMSLDGSCETILRLAPDGTFAPL